MTLDAFVEVPRVRRVLRRWGWLLLLAVVLGGSAAYVAGGRAPMRSQATATLLIGPPQGDQVDYQSILSFERAASTYVEMVLLEPALRRAIDEGALPLTPAEIPPLVDVKNPPATQFITVHVKHPDGDVAARLANALAEAFSIEVSNAPDGQARLITLISPAAASPAAPVPPGPSVSAVLGASLAFLVAAGGLLAVEAGSGSVTSPAEAQQIVGAPVLGRLGRLPSGSRRALMRRIATSDQGVGNWFRLLRTHFLNHLDAERNVFVLTSPHAGGGTTTTTLGLATVLGLAGYRVCIVDGDTRRPSMHDAFGVPVTPGLVDLVADTGTNWAEVACETPLANVVVIPAGSRSADDIESIRAPQLAGALRPLAAAFDVVLVDAAPIDVGAETLALRAGVGQTLLVTREGRTRLDALRRAVQDMERAGVRIVGLVYTDSVEV